MIDLGTTTPVTLAMPGLPPSPNELRGHWAKRRELTGPWRSAAFAVAKKQMALTGGKYPWDRARLYILFAGPRLWDADNMLSSCKPIIDGARQAGLITSDRIDHLTIEKIRFRKSEEREARLIFVPGIEA